MPPISQVTKQARKRKEAIVETIHECLGTYSHVYVFSMENMRTSILKDLRQKFADDRFIMGKQTVMALGVGRTPEEEPQENLHKLAEHLTGNAGLLFSNRPQKEVVAFYKSFSEEEFAVSGTPAKVWNYMVEVKEEELVLFLHSVDSFTSADDGDTQRCPQSGATHVWCSICSANASITCRYKKHETAFESIEWIF
jgi:mRNA turnover protein 4